MSSSFILFAETTTVFAIHCFVKVKNCEKFLLKHPKVTSPDCLRLFFDQKYKKKSAKQKKQSINMMIKSLFFDF